MGFSAFYSILMKPFRAESVPGDEAQWYRLGTDQLATVATTMFEARWDHITVLACCIPLLNHIRAICLPRCQSKTLPWCITWNRKWYTEVLFKIGTTVVKTSYLLSVSYLHSTVTMLGTYWKHWVGIYFAFKNLTKIFWSKLIIASLSCCRFTSCTSVMRISFYAKHPKIFFFNLPFETECLTSERPAPDKHIKITSIKKQ